MSCDKRRAAAAGADAHHGNRRLLAALAGDRGVDHARAADGGAGDGMQSVRKLARDAQRNRVAGAGGIAHLDQAGGGFVGNSKGQPRRAAHQHAAPEVRLRRTAGGPKSSGPR